MRLFDCTSVMLSRFIGRFSEAKVIGLNKTVVTTAPTYPAEMTSRNANQRKVPAINAASWGYANIQPAKHSSYIWTPGRKIICSDNQ